MSERKCRVCGCTDLDCRQCILKTGEPCYWVQDDLCSACAGAPPFSQLLDKYGLNSDEFHTRFKLNRDILPFVLGFMVALGI